MFYLCQKKTLARAIKALRYGGIIAFPTEAVYGLSCDPFNEKAVRKLLALKKRAVDKGLILIASSWVQVEHLIASVPAQTFTKIKAEIKPITWVFPASRIVPEWIKGKYDTVAIRVTRHPLAKAICDAYGAPLVSTSANIEGGAPAKNRREVHEYFPDGLDHILPGKLGEMVNPSEIRDASSGEVIRKG